MINLIDIFTVVLLVAGSVFFVAGTVGLLRFPDVFCRLHALTKSDNLGLGLITLGLLPQVSSIALAIKLLLIWILLMITSAASCHLIARNEHRKHGNQVTNSVARGESVHGG